MPDKTPDKFGDRFEDRFGDHTGGLKIRRALLSVSDKQGIVELGRSLHESGAELVATGKTAAVLREAGLPITPIEKLTGNPEAFQGRMKTLSFQVCSGILFRRGDPVDEEDLKRLGIGPIDCVVVNFYPFEAARARAGISRKELVEEIDIGGPTMVRAAAKNSPDVLVLTDPAQYAQVISELQAKHQVSRETAGKCSARAWQRVYEYDRAIAGDFGEHGRLSLRYGENPHQKASLEFDPHGPIGWGDEPLTPTELSYNNILDLSAAYALASDLVQLDPGCASVVIVKHNNPCGVAMIPRSTREAQKTALLRAWEGDPVSAFGGVLVFSDPIEKATAEWLSERFVELVAAPGLAKGNPALETMLARRKNLKAVAIRRFGEVPRETAVAVPGGVLRQSTDTGLSEALKSVTKVKWPESRTGLARFGIAVCRALKSNAIAIVREIPGVPGALQLIGAGQGQPNRVEALKALAIPRARAVLEATGAQDAELAQAVMVSDAFFPFRDTVDAAFEAGIRAIVQPGGSIKDKDSVAACDEHGMAMVFTGVRHFRH